MNVTIKCPHCGGQHVINPAGMMGKTTSEKKRASGQANALKAREARAAKAAEKKQEALWTTFRD